MVFYDFHVHTSMSIGENTQEEVIGVAKVLGYDGIGLVRYEDRPLEKNELDVVNVIMLKPKTVEELKKLVSKLRSKAEILMVHGGDYDINRAACENSAIDVLCHPELNRMDSGLDHICVRAAAENNVAIEINFREILESYKKRRVNILGYMRQNIMLCNKYGANIITTSGAVSKWGMRSPRELASHVHLLGLDLTKAIASVSTVPESILKKNREKLAGNRWEGVRVIE